MPQKLQEFSFLCMKAILFFVISTLNVIERVLNDTQ